MRNLFTSGRGPLLVLIDGGETAARLWESGLPDCSLLVFPAGDWDRDLTPWPAPGLGRERADFGGGADAFLAALLAAAAEAEASLGYNLPARGLLGYSLGGLFALYAGTRTDTFSLLGSVSGSLWYDGWCGYLAGQPCRAERVYLSLGVKEPKSGPPRMRRCGSCTEETEALLRAGGAETVYERNPGNHFTDPECRLRRAILWLLRS